MSIEKKIDKIYNQNKMTTLSSVIYARKNFNNKHIWINANCIVVFFLFFFIIHTFLFILVVDWSMQSYRMLFLT